MSKKKRIDSDVFEQGLISSKRIAAFLKATTHDKRSQKSTARAWESLSGGRTASDIGKQLGLSKQRVTSLRKQIESGKAYSPELRDILKTAAQEYHETPRKLEEGVYFFPNREKLEKTQKIQVIKSFPDLQDARNFWKMIINSGRYVAITQTMVREKRSRRKLEMYQVVGFGSRAQRPYAGKIKDHRAKNRIDQLLKKYK